MVKMLLDHGASVNCTSTEGLTPLHLAAGRGQVDMVQLLLGRGASINSDTNSGVAAVIMALSKQHSAVVQLLLNKGARTSKVTLLFAADHSDSEGVRLVVAALGPAADASVLNDACRSAAAASRMENAAVLLKQLCLVDPEAVEGVTSDLQQPTRAAAACVARWLAETKSVAEQQQRQVAAERLAVEQLLVATAGMQRQVVTERQAVQQLVVAAAGMQQQVATERQALRQHAGGESSVPGAQRRPSWALAREWKWHAMTTAAGLLLLVLLK
jgi:hypothetical protein